VKTVLHNHPLIKKNNKLHNKTNKKPTKKIKSNKLIKNNLESIKTINNLKLFHSIQEG
jgi:hypothetical protein